MVVGENERPRDECDAEDHRDGGEHEAQLVGDETLPRDLEHDPCLLGAQLAHLVEDRIGVWVVELVDDFAVGEEDDAVGVRRPRSGRG